MTIDFESMVTNERRKVVKLMQTALDLDISLDEYVEIGVNQSSGNVWLMHYDYNFVLYMPLYGADVWVSTTDNVTGEEYEEKLGVIGMNTDLLEAWANRVIEEEAS